MHIKDFELQLYRQASIELLLNLLYFKYDVDKVWIYFIYHLRYFWSIHLKATINKRTV